MGSLEGMICAEDEPESQAGRTVDREDFQPPVHYPVSPPEAVLGSAGCSSGDGPEASRVRLPG